MDSLTDELMNGLASLEATQNKRSLRSADVLGNDIIIEGKRYLNCSSNDYLGIGSGPLPQQFFSELQKQYGDHPPHLWSNPSSRLMTGNHPDYDRLEASLSALFPGKEALVLGSGYAANSGVLPAITGKEDLILADKLIHASLIEGIQLSEARWMRFHHNDLDHLERLLNKHSSSYKRIWVVTESVFSMDGDCAPLVALCDLKARYGFHLYVDEAHSFGVYGENGAGLCASLRLDSVCDVIVTTFGKAVSSSGAAVLCDPIMKSWLVNKMRPLIFSTALPPITLRWTDYVIRHLPQLQASRLRLQHYAESLAKGLNLPQISHIVPLHAGSNENALRLSEAFRTGGFWVTPIRYPTVPQGQARIRLSLTAGMTSEHITALRSLWTSLS